MPSLTILLIFYIIIANNNNNNNPYGLHLFTHDNDHHMKMPLHHQNDHNNSNVSKHRTKRGAFWDFFQKVFITKNLIADQYQDTTNTLNDVYNILNQQFSDTATKMPNIKTMKSLSENLIEDDSAITTTTTTTTTTTIKPQISRYEFGRILGRNYRGLKRLLDIEINDALNQSQSNINTYRREADRQFANSLPLEKKKLIKSYIG